MENQPPHINQWEPREVPAVITSTAVPNPATHTDTSTGSMLNTSLESSNKLGATSKSSNTTTAATEPARHAGLRGPPAAAHPADSSTAASLKDSLESSGKLGAGSRMAAPTGTHTEPATSKHIDTHGPPAIAGAANSATATMLESAIGSSMRLGQPPKEP